MSKYTDYAINKKQYLFLKEIVKLSFDSKNNLVMYCSHNYRLRCFVGSLMQMQKQYYTTNNTNDILKTLFISHSLIAPTLAQGPMVCVPGRWGGRG